MIIDLPRFVSAERPSWTELETMLHRIEREPKAILTLAEARRFHFLYQKVSADLNRVATFASEPELRRYLESLVARAYGEIQETREKSRPAGVFVWFFREFPRVFQRHSWAILLSIAVTLAGALLGGLGVALDNDAKAALVPEQFAYLAGDPAERVAREEAMEKDPLNVLEHTRFAAVLMANNIRVSINALALGMSWGIGTILVLFYNGISVGLVAMDYIMAGQTVFLFGWLMPHGVIEIPSFLIAGQAGLVLGRAVIGRGDRASLADRLRAVAPDVAILVGGVALLLVWAGLVESFLSQHHHPVLPYWLKIAFGLCEATVLGWFLLKRRA